MVKSRDAFRTISEVAEDLDLPQHVLRFWETRFSQIKPMKRGGGRRYYRPEDVGLLRGIRHLLYSEGYTIKGVQRILKERGARFVASGSANEVGVDKIEGEPLEVKAVGPLAINAAEPGQQPLTQKPPSLNTSKAINEPQQAPIAGEEKVKEVLTPANQQQLAASFAAPVDLAASVPGASSAPQHETENRSQDPADLVDAQTTPLRFAVTHAVPDHLVEAITSGTSMIETVDLPEDSANDVPEEPRLPNDILPEETSSERKTSPRALFSRFKTTGENNTSQSGGLLSDDIERLQDTLMDLLECKRLLDQIR